MNADVAFSISQFRDAWQLLCRACPAPRFSTSNGLDLIFSGLPVAFFNIGLVTGGNVSQDELADRARKATAYAGSTGLPWLFIVTHEALAADVDATSVLNTCGLAPMLPLTGMRATDVRPTERSPSDLQLGIADDAASCTAVFDINAAAYGADLDPCKPIFGGPTFWSDHVLSVGRVDGVPVASTAVLNVDGHRYVALVATMPNHQRRGYADAVMRHALEHSSTVYGPRPTMLHATDAGRPVYERMGYAPIANHTAFIEKRFLEGH